VWKDFEDRVLNYYDLKFTCDLDYSLGVIDFIDLKKEKGSFEGPPLPLTFVFAGAGTFANPYYLNLMDPLVKSVNYFIGDEGQLWNKFVTNFNSELFSISPYSLEISLKRRLLKLLDYVKRHNRIFRMHGFKIEVWLFEAILDHPSGVIEEFYPLDAEYLRRKPDVFDRFITYWKCENAFNKGKEFKLGVVLRPATATSKLSLAEGEGTAKSSSLGGPLHKGSDVRGDVEQPAQKSIQLLSTHIKEIHAIQNKLKGFKTIELTRKHKWQTIPLWFLGCLKLFAFSCNGVVRALFAAVVPFILLVVVDIVCHLLNSSSCSLSKSHSICWEQRVGKSKNSIPSAGFTSSSTPLPLCFRQSPDSFV